MFFYVALHDFRKEIRNKLPFKDVLIFCLFLLLSFCLLGYWGFDYLLFNFFSDNMFWSCNHFLPPFSKSPQRPYWPDFIFFLSTPPCSLSQKFLTKPIRKNTKSKQNETHTHKKQVFSVLANYSLASDLLWKMIDVFIHWHSSGGNRVSLSRQVSIANSFLVTDEIFPVTSPF